MKATLVESLCLLFAVSWLLWILYSTEFMNAFIIVNSSPINGVPTLAQCCFWFITLSIISISMASLYIPLPMELMQLSREESDCGLKIGQILPPLALFSRLLVMIQCTSSSPSIIAITGLDFLYLWISMTYGLSQMIHLYMLAPFIQSKLIRTMLIDGILLPIFMLNTATRITFTSTILPIVGRVLFHFILDQSLKYFPKSFTIGEATLMTQGIGFCILSVLIHTCQFFTQFGVFPSAIFTIWEIPKSWTESRHHVSFVLEFGAFSIILLTQNLYPVFQKYGVPIPRASSPKTLPRDGIVSFILRTVPLCVFVLLPWLYILINEPVTSHPSITSTIYTILAFLFTKTRICIIIFWIISLGICLPLCMHVKMFPQIIHRKLFHLLAVFLFVPVQLLDGEFLAICYGLACYLFVVLEWIRGLAIPPLGPFISKYFYTFLDRRDTAGRVVTTHLYLLLGCAVPLWFMANAFAPLEISNLVTLQKNSGVLALGIGDTMGAVIGSQVGKFKVFGSKTIEGTFAVWISLTLSSYCIIGLQDFGIMIQVALACSLTALVEASTAQIDNLVLSLYFMSVCNLVTLSNFIEQK